MAWFPATKELALNTGMGKIIPGHSGTFNTGSIGDYDASPEDANAS